MATTEKGSRSQRPDKRRRISHDEIFQAGLGVLRDEGLASFDGHIRSGRRVFEHVAVDPREGRGKNRRNPLTLRFVQSIEVVGGPSMTIKKVTFDPRGQVTSTVERTLDLAPSPGDLATRSMPEVIESMMPAQVPTAPMVLQARRNSAARTELMNEFGLLTSADIAELNQSKAGNRAALASRWKREGRIFSVKHDGRDWFPGFQLHPDGTPREAIAATLKALDGARGWETALWFTTANGYLEGRRPVDLLEEDCAAVVEAAGHEAEEVFF